MLTLCGQRFEPVWTDFGTGITRTPEWRATVNEMGEIPVLEEDGQKLTQTAPILLRLSERYGRFGGTTDAERFEVLRWLFWDNHKMSGTMAPYRFFRTFARKADPAVQQFMRRRIDDYLSVLDGHVRDHPFLAGDRPTIADLSTCAYLSYPSDETGYDFAATHPHVHAWLARIATLPGWASPYDLIPGQRLPRYDQG